MKKTVKKMGSLLLALSMITGLLPGSMGAITARAESGDNYETASEIIGRYYGEWTDQNYSGAITNRIPQTALLGNGDVGITSYGKEGEKTFLVSKADFWNYLGSPIAVGGITIKEDIPEDSKGPVNLAVLATATASTTHENYIAERAISGSLVQGTEGWVSNPDKNTKQWIQLTFEEEVNIGKWVLVNDGGIRPGESGNNARDFRFQSSSDGLNWTDITIITANKADIVEKKLDKDITTKYIRFYFDTPNQQSNSDQINNPRARVGQIFLYPPTEGENVAQSYSNIAASSVHESYHPNRAVDGNFVYGNEGWVSQVEQTPWMKLSFDEAVTFDRYVIYGDEVIRDNGSNNNNPKAFRLQISEDGAVWVDVDIVTNNTEGKITRILTEPVTTSYVRLYLDKPVQRETEANPRARIGRFELRFGDGEDVKIEEPVETAPFYEKQDILKAEIQTEVNLGSGLLHMETWLGTDQNILVTEVTSLSEEKPVDLAIETWATASNSSYPAAVQTEDGQVYVTRRTAKKTTNASLSGTTTAYVSETAMTTRIIGSEAEDIKAIGTNKGSQKITLEPGERIYVITAIGGGGQIYDAATMALKEGVVSPIIQAKTIVNKIDSKEKADDLKITHDNWWRDYWSTSYIDFGTGNEKLNKIQAYYYAAQYLLGSGLREDGIAGGLYGIWHTNDTTSWSSDYHLNYNFISAYYGLNSSNRSELTLPAVNAITDYITTGRQKASSTTEVKRLLPGNVPDFISSKIAKGDIDSVTGIADAILYPVGIGPYGMTLDNGYHNEAMNASYSAYPMTEYYEYTLDEEFKESVLYPYLKLCAAFYEKWLEKEDLGDSYTYVLYAGYNEGSWSKNPAVEIATLKNVLVHAIQYSEELNVDSERRAIWTDIYDHLPGQPTVVKDGLNALSLAELEYTNGAWKELTSPLPSDANAIPLDAIIPGGVYNHFSTKEELALVQNTITVFNNNSNPWTQINNFPRLFPIAVECRYDINTIVDKFTDTLNRQMKANLLVDDNTHGFEKAGSMETINQMMLNSEEGMIEVFPNWLENQDAKFGSLRAKGAFTVSASYSGSEKSVTSFIVNSEKGQECCIVSPWIDGMTVLDSEGKKVNTVKGHLDEWEQDTYAFATKAGETYSIIQGVEEDVDITALELKIEQAEAISSEGYTQESYQKLLEAIINAKEAMEDGTITQEQVDALILTIENAISELEILPEVANKEELSAKLAIAEALDSEIYTEESYAVLEAAIETARTVMEDDDATEEEVSTCITALEEAMESLIFKSAEEIWYLDSIKITALPDKTVYQVNNNFVPTGMVVKAVYKEALTSSVKEEIINNYTLNYDFSSAGQKQVIISFTGLDKDGGETLATAIITVTVNAKSSSGTTASAKSGSQTTASAYPSSNGNSADWRKDQTGWWMQLTGNNYAKKEWKLVDGVWYYFDASGYMVVGWRQLNNSKWYYFNSNGAMLKSDWIFYKDAWYYLNADGIMAESQWIFYKDNWYYISADGKMAVNTVTPDGYSVNGDGIWVK